jgi:putative aldouronate transport system substrate-binding protein
MTPHTNRRTVLKAGAAGLGLAGVAPVLAACSGSSIPGGSGAPAADYEQGSASLEVELGPEIDGVNYPEDYVGPRHRELEPFGDGQTEFSVLGRSIPGLSYPENHYANLVEEKTGVAVAYQDVPLGDDGQTTVNAMLSGGDLPDAIMCGMALFTPSQVAIYGEMGMFVPVDELIDRLAPHIREMFQQFPEMRSLFTAPDGRMYAVPSMNDCYHCKSSDVRTWINSDFVPADAHPQTLAEFESLMAEVKEHPDWADSGPIVTTTSTTVPALFNFFLGSFLPVSTTHLLLDGGSVVWGPSQEGYREGLSWIQKQFRAGHFSADMFALTDEQLKRLGDAAGGPGFLVTHGGSQGSFTSVNDPSQKGSAAQIMVPLAPMEGPGGVRTCDWNWFQIGSPNFVITSACEDPETMIRWADYQFELGMTVAMGAGEKGVGWDFADEGTLGINGAQAVYSRIPNELDNQTWWEWGPFFKSESQRHGEAVPEGTKTIEGTLYEAGKAYEPYQIPKESKLPLLVFTTEEAAQVGEAETNLRQHLEQFFAAIGTGRADVDDDADWQEFQDGFTSRGVENFLEIQQTAYDRQFG